MKLWFKYNKQDILTTTTVVVLAAMSAYVLKEGYDANQAEQEKNKEKWLKKFEVIT